MHELQGNVNYLIILCKSIYHRPPNSGQTKKSQEDPRSKYERMYYHLQL